jgi:hypothetical protein
MQMDIDYDNDVVAPVLDSIPPGDEGFGISHEGGEYQILEDFANGIGDSDYRYVYLFSIKFYSLCSRKRFDDRNRRNRIDLRNNAWETQLDMLVDAYLRHQFQSDGEQDDAPAPTETSSSFTMEVFDLFCMRVVGYVEDPD